MRLFIPEIGIDLKLLEDWTFPLYYEHRNAKLFQALGVPPLPQDGFGITGWEYQDHSRDEKSETVTLPKGTILKVDRVYIRKSSIYGGDASKYSSVSFWAKLKGHKKKARFWAKLPDVNRVECVVLKP